MAPVLRPTLERHLKAEQAGEVRFDAFTRGRYHRRLPLSFMPLGVVAAHDRRSRSGDRNCCAEGVPVTTRGGGTSQCGQTVNEVTRPRLLAVSELRSTSSQSDGVACQPGIVLDRSEPS